MNDGFRNLDVDVSLKLAFESLVPAVEKVRAELENLVLLQNQLTDVAADRPFFQSQRLADEISARERLIHRINEETSASETRISATESIVSSQYQRQPLDENKFQPSARALSSSTARERDVAQRLGSPIGAVGLGGLNQEQRDAATSNSILGPLVKQILDDEHRQGPNREMQEFMAQLQSSLGLKSHVDEANNNAAIDLHVNPNIAVSVGIQSFDKMTQELNDKLLPAMINAFRQAIADVEAKVNLKEQRRINQAAGTWARPAGDAGF